MDTEFVKFPNRWWKSGRSFLVGCLPPGTRSASHGGQEAARRGRHPCASSVSCRASIAAAARSDGTSS